MKLKNSFVKATAAAALTIGGLATVNAVKPSATSHVQAATTQIKVKYVQGYGVNIWNNYEGGRFTGKRAQHGTTWNVLDTKTDSKGNTWYEIGENQWIDGKYAVDASSTAATKTKKKSTQASATASSIISLAKAQVGKPYSWGSAGPSAFDCSGLVQYVYKNAAGIDVTRTTYTQIKQGTSVSMSNLQPGDLLFWGSATSPYHVGIYLGNNQYVHAATPKQGVIVQSLSSYFYPSAAKRVLN
ncbi:C40 family peptidase [Lactobacillus kalixensis]|uniref:Cell wall-associated hydrolase n=1 Tax=Lactobacillus kalixensis DSM 16043 TaxID=1423763 RepID=A0A0R1UBY1_9LACO|nr:C40 family peptidase [Lactobacillus kalixensis]KRL90905.1 cell wall-associated hydrolase [Lactobacillus kalixensis DSM 16043]